MPYKDLEKAREYRKRWREKNKERMKEYEHQPHIKEVRRKYRMSQAGKEAQRRYHAKPESKEKARKYYKLPKIQQYHYKYRLGNKGISPEDYDKIFREQNGLCAICFEPPSPNRRLCVDHNHKRCSGYKSCGKCVRGLLCDDCNHMLGSSKDSILILQEAIKYLTKWSN